VAREDLRPWKKLVSTTTFYHTEVFVFSTIRE